MKKFISACMVLVTLVPVSFGQNKADYNRQQAIGISFFLNDFITANRIRTTSLNQVISDKSFAKIGDMSPGLSVTYFKGLGNHVDFAGSLGGSFIRYPMPNRTFSGESFLLEGTAQVNLKMTSEQYWVQPYITAGVGGFKYRSYYGAFMPLGLGLKVNFFDEAHLFITSTYRVPVTTETANYHFQHSIGIAGIIGGGKKKVNEVIPTPPPPPDTDGDGVSDPNDKCPDVRGMVRYGGCPIPDSDKDGVNDEEDKCPSVAGLVRYGGCPVPDTDKDGITDEDDSCPEIFGVVRYKGCPVPDKDKDGVNDEDDKCIDLPGSADNLGCPDVSADLKQRVDLAAKSILFVGNTSKLNAKSNKGLDDVAKILQAGSALKVNIESPSDAQASVVKSYLVKKGIAEDRVRIMTRTDGNNSTSLTLSYF